MGEAVCQRDGDNPGVCTVKEEGDSGEWKVESGKWRVESGKVKGFRANDGVGW